MAGHVLRTCRDGVVELRLNRPDRRNALSTDLLRALRDELDAVRSDPAARAVVLTGEGRVFCAGADIAEFGPDADATRVLTRTRLVVDVLTRLAESEHPTIAAVNGPAVGGGWGLALVCDLCFAADTATFSLPEVAKGYRLPAVVVSRLARIVGPVRAADIALFGTTQSAVDAFDLGCVNRVLPERDLLDQAWTTARALAGTRRRGIAAVKAALRPPGAFPPPELFWTEE